MSSKQDWKLKPLANQWIIPAFPVHLFQTAGSVGGMIVQCGVARVPSICLQLPASSTQLNLS